MALIIIEGVDGSGKSTLAETIADQLRIANPEDKVDLWHAGPPQAGEHPLDLYERPLWDYVPGTGRHIVIDRWHIGEWIYPSVFQRITHADIPTWRHIDMFLQSRGAVLVHATPPIQQVVANIERRGDDLVNVRQLYGIHASYQSMIAASNLPKIRYAAIGNPFIPGETMRLARHMEAKAARLRDFITYVGPLQPKYLLLGDVRHDLRNQTDYLIPGLTREYGPAFGPYKSTSGHFLLNHLPYDLITDGRGGPARGVGLANACDVDDPSVLWEALGKPATVALGQNAAKCVKFATAHVPHPQYMRRFQAHSGAEYGQAIAESLGF